MATWTTNGFGSYGNDDGDNDDDIISGTPEHHPAWVLFFRSRKAGRPTKLMAEMPAGYLGLD